MTRSRVNALTAHAHCADIILMFETHNIGQTLSSLECDVSCCSVWC